MVLFPLPLPPPLQAGDLVRVVSPSGALREFAAFERGLEIWRSRGYRIELSRYWNIRYGYLAGNDCQRRQALAEAWQDPECKAILCTRGGYGSGRLLEGWSWDQKEEEGNKGQEKQGDKETSREEKSIIQPKWMLGFSDVTGLLWSLAMAGIAGVHGPVLTTLAAEPDWTRQRLFDCLEGRPLEALKGKGWGGGRVAGRLLPGNLTVATHLLGTPNQPPLSGTILALEDVAEAPYRLDRLLTQWRLLGAFRGVRGIALGRFSRCHPATGSFSWTVAEMLQDRLGDLGIPIVSDLPFGHDGANAALPVGQIAELDGKEGTLVFK